MKESFLWDNVWNFGDLICVDADNILIDY